MKATVVIMYNVDEKGLTKKELEEEVKKYVSTMVHVTQLSRVHVHILVNEK